MALKLCGFVVNRGHRCGVSERLDQGLVGLGQTATEIGDLGVGGVQPGGERLGRNRLVWTECSLGLRLALLTALVVHDLGVQILVLVDGLA